MHTWSVFMFYRIEICACHCMFIKLYMHPTCDLLYFTLFISQENFYSIDMGKEKYLFCKLMTNESWKKLSITFCVHLENRIMINTNKMQQQHIVEMGFFFFHSFENAPPSWPSWHLYPYFIAYEKKKMVKMSTAHVFAFIFEKKKFETWFTMGII